MQKDVSNPNEFLDSVKLDLFSGEVFVFTPTGDVKDFPTGSTPIDFAYSIHTDVGSTCTGAKVNERIVPLKYKLRSGDIVEIFTSKNQVPRKEWLISVKTAKAKSKIKQYLKKEERERYKEIGKDILEKELRKYSLTINKIIKTSTVKEILDKYNYRSIEEIYINLGYGKIIPKDILAYFIDQPSEEIKNDESSSILSDLYNKAKRFKKKNKKSAITVGGENEHLVRFAKCCMPIHGDPIVGFITRGRGITVHHKDCNKVLDIEEERRIDIEWNDGGETARIIKIRVETANTKGLLLKISKVLSENGADVLGANIKMNNLNRAICFFDISIKDTKQLAKIQSSLMKTSGVFEVSRISS